MNKFALKSALAALIVSVPLAGAFADENSNRNEAAGIGAVPVVDTLSTASIGGSHAASNWKQLQSQINAAQTNLQPRERGSDIANVGAAAHVQGQLNQIRSAATAEAKANGGNLSQASYQSYSAQLRALQDNIYALQNG